MKIGVSSYSFYQYISSGKLDDISVIHKASEMGFDAIEFTGFSGSMKEKTEHAAAVRAEAEKTGIELSAYVVGADFLLKSEDEKRAVTEKVKRDIDIANILGVKLFRYDVAYFLPAGVSFYSVLDSVVGCMREIAEYGKKYGIMTMIENHGQAFQDSDRVENVFAAVNHPNFGLLVDIGNFMCADEDPVYSVSRIANLARHVHLKDFVKLDYYDKGSRKDYFATRGCNYLKGTAVGYGDAKAAQCISILKQAVYDGYMDIEYEGHDDCIEELEKGLAFRSAM